MYSEENPLKHNFSKHDSQRVFHDSATYLENSKTKCRAKTAFGRSSEFKKDLISWIPIQTERQQQWPLISTYKADFWHHRNPQSTAVMIPQLLVPRVRPLITVAHPRSEIMQTTYRQFYSHRQPNPNVHTNVFTGEVQSTPMEKEATFVYLNPKPKTARLSDGGVSDMGLSHMGLSDMGRSDVGLPDTGHSDMGHSDMGLSDMGFSNMGHSDMGLSDMGVSDMGVSNIGLSDGGVSDMGLSDMGLSDMGFSDMGLSDMGFSNMGHSDMGLSDMGVSDMGSLIWDSETEGLKCGNL
ncbi:hypothetical protein scyTo_0007184 [Scyliorhinus torazame]|uniref:Uncharacterized protein n=1 Tax=Scyliorhinus torazame TaxID=75743 RepID=A0A401NMX2_SCYTO|nr:hypothetical protein [Scyliorhinus torazame]